jgi:hypothetical protein
VWPDVPDDAAEENRLLGEETGTGVVFGDQGVRTNPS